MQFNRLWNHTARAKNSPVAMATVSMLLLLLCVSSAFGQGVSGRLLGSVFDPSKAAIPNARVTVSNQDTGIQLSLTTNEDGSYLAPYLPPGTYTVQVSVSGFQGGISKDNLVQVDHVTRVDFTLTVGGTTADVTVSGESPLVENTTSDIGVTISEAQLENQPLNGRIYTQFVQQLPGAVGDGWSTASEAAAGAGARTAITADVNGMNFEGTMFTLDGLYNMEPLNAFVNITPPIDALEEMSIKTSNSGADVGNYGGAQVNATIKSGTNEVHGFLFEYLRNDALNAHLYNFTSATVPKAPFKSNQFGAGIGGPIIKNKLFYFGDYQGTRLVNGYQDIWSVPTELERQGIFSPSEGFPTIYDPNSQARTAFPNNTIPSSRFDPVVASVLAEGSPQGMATDFWPLPNVKFSSCSEGECRFNNFAGVHSEPQNVNQFDVKGDYQAGSNDRIFIRESYVHSDTTVPPIGGAVYGSNLGHLNASARDHNAAIGYFHTFTGNLSNELRLGYNRFWTFVANTSYRSNENERIGIPNAIVQGFAGTSDVIRFNFTNQITPSGGPGWGDGVRMANTYQLLDDLTWTHGKHTLRFGGRFELVQSSDWDAQEQEAGGMSFWNCYTADATCSRGGDPWASFLLGADYTYTRTFIGETPLLSWRWPSIYAQDDYRITKNLTLNLGLQWDEFSRPVDRHNHLANFNLSTGLIDIATSSNRTDNVDGFNGVAPRVGFAYQVNDKTAVRAGSGINFYNDAFGATGGFLESAFPFFQTVANSDLTGTNVPQYTVGGTGLQPYAAVPITPHIDLTMVAPNNNVSTVLHEDKNFAPDSIYTWNFGIQRQLGRSSVLDASYVGTQGRHLFRALPVNSPRPGVSGDPEVNRPYATLVPGLPDIYINSASTHGWSAFNSLQVKYTRRMANGLQALASYAWQKSMDDHFYVFDPYDDAHNRYLSYFDHAHVVNASYIYELPFGNNKMWLHESSRPVNWIAGGWMTTGIITLHDGDPLFFTYNCYSLGIYNDPLNSECSSPAGANLANLDCGHLKKVGSPNEWFDSNGCFSVPASLQWGNAPAGIVRGPGIVNFDMSFFKSEKIRESSTLKFSADFFNIFNNPHFGDPHTQYDPTQPSAAAYGFGQISSLSGSNSEREIQFSVKLSF